MHDELGLGQIITTQQQRDAVHIAVILVLATSELNPGEHVGVIDGNPPKSIQYSKHSVGVVDPFLKLPVKNAQTFWLYLYPGSITSLRHDWTHLVLKHKSTETTNVGVSDYEWKEAVEWLTKLAARCGTTYANLVYAAESGDGMCFGDTDYPQYILEYYDKLWECIEIVSGKSMSASHRDDTYFRCAC